VVERSLTIVKFGTCRIVNFLYLSNCLKKLYEQKLIAREGKRLGLTIISKFGGGGDDSILWLGFAQQKTSDETGVGGLKGRLFPFLLMSEEVSAAHSS
jgi:hypothetical protein